MIEIKVPSPGESVTTVTLAAWLVADGEYVEKNQEIAEIDSDKATLSISAPESGVVTILLKVGEQAGVGEVVARIAEGAASGHEKAETIVREKVSAQAESVAVPDPAAVTGGQENLHFTPLAKAFMTAEGIQEQDVIKMMHHHKVRKSDLEHLYATSGISEEAITDHPIGREERREKMSSLRIKLSQRLVGVKNETAMLTTFNEVDMSEVLRIRKDYGKAFEAKHGVKLGLMAFFTRAATLALQEFTRVNAFIDHDEVVFHDFVDVSIAVSTPKGLVVPVIRNSHTMSLAAIELEIQRLAGKARTNKLTLEEMTGGTFTITNGGVFGSMLSTPIINPPQSAILGMHNIVERPVAVNGKVEIRPVMYVALSYDHRIIDGRESVGFLVKVKESIENPVSMLLKADPFQKLLDI